MSITKFHFFTISIGLMSENLQRGDVQSASDPDFEIICYSVDQSCYLVDIRIHDVFQCCKKSNKGKCIRKLDNQKFTLKTLSFKV